MTLEIKKLDEKRFELVETNKVVKNKEELKMVKNNILKGIAQMNQQLMQIDSGTKNLLTQLKTVNVALGLEPTDGLAKKE